MLDPAPFRPKFAEAMRKARVDGLVFAVTTIFLTPLFLFLAIVVLFFAVGFTDLPVVDNAGYSLSFATGFTAAMIFMVGSFFMKPKATWKLKRALPWKWVGTAIGILVLLLIWTYATPFARELPGLFWPVYGLLALTMMGFLGHAYEPGEDYYLGWETPMGYMDDFTTTEDDIDRAHFALGFAVAFPRLIFGSYAGIFGSSWLLRGLDGTEQWAAVDVLIALAAKKIDLARERIAHLGHDRGLRVMRGLDKMGLIRMDQAGPRLCVAGEKFLGLSEWH